MTVAVFDDEGAQKTARMLFPEVVTPGKVFAIVLKAPVEICDWTSVGLPAGNLRMNRSSAQFADVVKVTGALIVALELKTCRKIAALFPLLVVLIQPPGIVGRPACPEVWKTVKAKSWLVVGVTLAVGVDEFPMVADTPSKIPPIELRVGPPRT